jgi:glycosyltransferase involved in cell wall biosynthesis
VTSIVIPAHNEAAVVGRCLDAVLAGAVAGEFDVTVVANGCSDATVRVASARAGVRVLDLPGAGKVAALNAGDAVAVGFPRVYLDADIVIGAAGVGGGPWGGGGGGGGAGGAAGGRGGGPLAVTARRVVDVSRSPLLVRWYYAVNSRLPVFTDALFGRGVIAVSEQGRGRFGEFPDVVADDLFLDSLFAPGEKREVESVSSRVAAPRRTGDLLRRLVRVRRGNAAMRAALAAADGGAGGGRGGGRVSWARVVLRDPALIPAGVCYAGLTLAACVLARFPQRPGTWGRDDSSRQDDYDPGSLEAADGLR